MQNRSMETTKTEKENFSVDNFAAKFNQLNVRS